MHKHTTFFMNWSSTLQLVHAGPGTWKRSSWDNWNRYTSDVNPWSFWVQSLGFTVQMPFLPKAMTQLQTHPLFN